MKLLIHIVQVCTTHNLFVVCKFSTRKDIYLCEFKKFDVVILLSEAIGVLKEFPLNLTLFVLGSSGMSFDNSQPLFWLNTDNDSN